MSRFLITTDDESTWKFDRPVIFLGKWCLNDSRREVWQSMDYSIIDQDSIDRVLPDLYRQTQLLHSQLSIDLASALNSFHGLAFSNRFWRVVTGPWLRSFCDNFILRWAYMNLAINEFNANESDSVLDDADPFSHPRNFSEYRSSQKRQDWNQYIYSKMWSLMSNPELPSPFINQANNVNSRIESPVSPEKSVSGRQVILTDTYLPRTSEAMLSILMRSKPAKNRRIAPPHENFDERSRTQLKFTSAPISRLHAIARELVRDQILTAYVEGFTALIESVPQLRLPDSPRLIFTSNRHLYDDVFNAWVALATENGSKFIIGQHGGHYGLSRFPSSSELHEEDISDRYLTWGRTDSKKQTPVPCLTTVGRRYRPSDKATHLLVVCDPIWKYPRSLFSDISEHSGYLEHVAKCVTSLPADLGKDVLVRLSHAHAETGSSQAEWWKTRAPTINLDAGLSNIQSLIRKSRVVVATSNGTTFLETLNLNIPTLITWSSGYVQLRDSALPYFQLLEEVGIFHDNAQSFANHITKNWGDIESWWASEVVQSARLMFCSQFSKIQSHPLLFLRRTLHSVSM